MKKLPLFIFFLLTANCLFAQIRMGQNRRYSIPSNEVSYSNPKEYEIAEIKVNGLETLSETAIVSLAGLAVGDKIKVPGDDITTALKNIWGQGIIADVSVNVDRFEGDKVYLRIDLTERPRLSRFNFQGVNKSQEGELKDKISLFRGRVLTDAMLKNTELTVKKYFVEKGYLNANVKLEQVRDTLARNSVRLNIVVDRNSKVKVARINFHGNEALADQRLRKKMKSTKEKVRFTLVKDIFNRIYNVNGPAVKEFLTTSEEASIRDVKSYLNDHVKLNFLNASKFIRTDYETDKNLVIDFYNSQGYRDARIVEDTLYKVGPNAINIDIKVEEGNKYYFRDIIWTGNYVYTDDQLSRTLGIDKGDVYDMDKLHKRINYNPTGPDVSSLYMDNGYLLGFSINPVEIRVEGDSIDVEMRVSEGPQATINKIIIKGNETTNDHVILREIRTLPGQKFSRSDVIRTQRELSQLGYFDPEKIGINPIPNYSDGSIDMEYSLVERANDQIELSGGWGGVFGFVGTLGLVFNNFSIRNVPDLKQWRPIPKGDGQRLALRAQASGQRFQSYSATFSEPWLGGRRANAFTVNLTHSVQRDIDWRDNTNRGSLQVSGATVSLGRRVRWPDDFFTLSNSLSYLRYNADRFRFFSLGFRDDTGIAHSITFNTTIARNSIDQPMYPRTGSQLSLSANFTPPYSLLNGGRANERLIEYHKWMFDSRNYITLAGNLVLETRAHLGFLGSYGAENITAFERFNLGGAGLGAQGQGMFLLGRDIIGLRGYEENSLVPTEQRNGRTISGGVAFNKFVMELRYPVSLSQAATIYVLGFGEAGNTWNNYAEFNPFRIQRTAGFGARIFMAAFGLIGIDWAYGFDRLPGQLKPSGGQFHFSIGQQIR